MPEMNGEMDSLANELSNHIIGQTHGRDDNHQSRNVRQNVGQNVNSSTTNSSTTTVNDNINILNDGVGIYLKKKKLDKNNLKNIEIVTSNSAVVLRRRPFDPKGSLVSLEELIENGSVRRKNLVLVILSISASSNNQHTTTYQQRVIGGKGNNGTIRHNRSMVVMCPLSKEGSNTAIILFGPGYNESLLNGDPGLRDTGEISKLYLNDNNGHFMFMHN